MAHSQAKSEWAYTTQSLGLTKKGDTTDGLPRAMSDSGKIPDGLCDGGASHTNSKKNTNGHAPFGGDVEPTNNVPAPYDVQSIRLWDRNGDDDDDASPDPLEGALSIHDVDSDIFEKTIVKELLNMLPYNLHLRKDLPLLTKSQIHRLAFSRREALCISTEFIRLLWDTKFSPLYTWWTRRARAAVATYKKKQYSDISGESLSILREALDSLKVKIDMTTVLFQGLCFSRFTVNNEIDGAVSDIFNKAASREALILKFIDAVRKDARKNLRGPSFRSDISRLEMPCEPPLHEFPLLCCTYDADYHTLLDELRGGLSGGNITCAAQALLCDYVGCGLVPLNGGDEPFITGDGLSGTMQPKELLEKHWGGNVQTAMADLKQWVETQRDGAALDTHTPLTLADMMCLEREIEVAISGDPEANIWVSQEQFRKFCRAVRCRHPWLYEHSERHWRACKTLRDIDENESVHWSDMLLYLRDVQGPVLEHQEDVSPVGLVPSNTHTPQSIAVHSDTEEGRAAAHGDYRWCFDALHQLVAAKVCAEVTTAQQRETQKRIGCALAQVYFSGGYTGNVYLSMTGIHCAAFSLTSALYYSDTSIWSAAVSLLLREVYDCCYEAHGTLQGLLREYLEHDDQHGGAHVQQLEKLKECIVKVEDMERATKSLPAISKLSDDIPDYTHDLRPVIDIGNELHASIQLLGRLLASSFAEISPALFLLDSLTDHFHKFKTMIPEIPLQSPLLHAYMGLYISSDTMKSFLLQRASGDVSRINELRTRIVLSEYMGWLTAPFKGNGSSADSAHSFMSTSTAELVRGFHMSNAADVVDDFRRHLVNVGGIDAAVRDIRKWWHHYFVDKSIPFRFSLKTRITLAYVYGHIVTMNLVCGFNVSEGMNRAQFTEFCQAVKEYHPWLSEDEEKHWEGCQRISGRVAVGWIDFLLYLRDLEIPIEGPLVVEDTSFDSDDVLFTSLRVPESIATHRHRIYSGQFIDMSLSAEILKHHMGCTFGAASRAEHSVKLSRSQMHRIAFMSEKALCFSASHIRWIVAKIYNEMHSFINRERKSLLLKVHFFEDKVKKITDATESLAAPSIASLEDPDLVSDAAAKARVMGRLAMKAVNLHNDVHVHGDESKRTELDEAMGDFHSMTLMKRSQCSATYQGTQLLAGPNDEHKMIATDCSLGQEVLDSIDICDYAASRIVPIGSSCSCIMSSLVALPWIIRYIIDKMCVCSTETLRSAYDISSGLTQDDLRRWKQVRPAELDAKTAFTLEDVMGFITVMDYICWRGLASEMDRHQFDEFCSMVREYHPWLSQDTERHWYRCTHPTAAITSSSVGLAELLIYLRDLTDEDISLPT